MNPSNAAADPAAPSLSVRLREATSAQHARAEKHPVQQALVRGSAEIELYATWLRAMAALHERFEARLTEARAVPSIAPVIEDHHFRLALIDEDLAALASIGAVGAAGPCAKGMTGTSGTSSASLNRRVGARTRAAWFEIDAIIARDATAILGPFYVLEGSTNGGRFIAMALRKSLPLPDGKGTRYLDPHGERIRERWAAAKAAMDAVPLTEAQRALIIDAAKRTFDAVTVLMDELELPAAR